MRTNQTLRLLLLSLTAIAAGLLAAPASPARQSGFDMPGFGKQGSDRPEVVVSATPQYRQVAPGDRMAVAVILDHAPHWHTWPSEAQDVLPEEIAQFAIRTAISVDRPDWVAAVGEVQWPEPIPGPVADPTGGSEPVSVPLYQGKAVAYLPIAISENAPAGEVELPVNVTYQACDDTSCLAPQDVSLRVGFEISSGEPVVTPDAENLFAGLDASVLAELAPAPGDDQSANEQAAEVPGTPGAPGAEFLGLSIGDLRGPLGIMLLALLSAAGGFVLNLTPCVLPVIPIKIMTLTQHAGSPGRSLYLGLWMAAGVVAFWSALGLPAAFVSTFSDPSRMFGIWWLTLGIGVLIAFMSLGLMGMFSITLPQKLYMVNPEADTPFGSFLFGVMTGVLGLPCFGFVVGALLPSAAVLGSGTVMLVFAGIGVGMAAPYLVLSARPSLVERVPRTGPASELVKQVMGLLLLGAAAYFIGAGLLALTQDMPYVAPKLHYWVIALCGIGAGAWLILRTFQITRKATPRGVFSVVGIVLAGGGLLLAVNMTAQAKEEYEKKVAAKQQAIEQGGLLTSTWNDYSPALFERARESGKVVVVDFTAEWCINCKALKATVLNVEPVKSVLESEDVIMIKADLTSTGAEGWDFLRSLGQTGIPLLAIWGPGQEEPWKSAAYNSQQVLRAIEKARGETADAGQEADDA